MIPSLEKSEQFQTELAKYNETILKITDQAQKDQLAALVRGLVLEVRKLDSQHTEIFERKQMPEGISQSRSKIQEIRIKIDQLIKTVRG